MEKEKNIFDASCESDLRNLQKNIADLVAYVELRSLSKQQDTHTALKQSQYRLIKYKELLLHAEHLDETELLLMYTELSKVEKSIAKLGVDALTIAIDRLDKAFLNN